MEEGDEKGRQVLLLHHSWFPRLVCVARVSICLAAGMREGYISYMGV